MRATIAASVALALAGSAAAAPVTGNVTTSIEKRQTYSNERFTWYNPSVGTGACGGWNADSDFVSISLRSSLLQADWDYR